MVLMSKEHKINLNVTISRVQKIKILKTISINDNFHNYIIYKMS